MAILIMIGYAVVWSVGCSPMAILAHETLGCTGIDSRIALAGVESYGHYHIMIGGNRTNRDIWVCTSRATSTTTIRCASTTAPKTS